jgi:hypothetical protein
MHPAATQARRRSDPQHAARRRKILRGQELPVQRRPARRGRVGGQRVIAASWKCHDSAATATSTACASPAARRRPIWKSSTRCGKRNTGTTVTLHPRSAKYFDTVVFSVSAPHGTCCAPRRCCARASTSPSPTRRRARRRGVVLRKRPAGLHLADATIDFPTLPAEPFVGSFSGKPLEAVDWAVQWLPEGGEVVAEILCEPDSRPIAGWHPRQRHAHRSAGCDARILRVAAACCRAASS